MYGLAQGVWRLLPPGWRSAGAPAVGRVLYEVFARRVRREPVAQPAAPGVAVVGFHSACIGLGRGARLQVDAFRQAGVEVEVVDLSDLLERTGWTRAVRLPEPAGAGTVITHLNPPEMVRYLGLTAGRPVAGRRHIGYWAWELPDAPRAWRSAFHLVDEVWAPSEFTAAALRKIAPEGAPVRVAPHPIHLEAPAPAVGHRTDPARPLVALAALDIRSTFARKNLDGALQIVRTCAARAPGRVRFVLKITGSRADPEAAEHLRRRLHGIDGLELVDSELSHDEMLALIGRADVILSPHRAEGFGLLLGEAMNAGKPVIATNWSGNTDFMDADSAILLDYTLTSVRDPQRRYRGSRWAEPDLDQAVEGLLRLADDPAYGRTLGEAGRSRLHEALGGQDWIALTGLAGQARRGPELSGAGGPDTKAGLDV